MACGGIRVLLVFGCLGGNNGLLPRRLLGSHLATSSSDLASLENQLFRAAGGVVLLGLFGLLSIHNAGETLGGQTFVLAMVENHALGTAGLVTALSTSWLQVSRGYLTEVSVVFE
jgi:hypothetical protein